jgi:two-component system, sensor histidine kinase YesM
MIRYANFSLSIFMKLVLTLMLVVVPLYTLSLVMNNSGSDTVREEISKSTMSRVQFYMHLLEVEFSRIIRLQQEYVNDEDLGKLAVAADAMSDIERMMANLHLERRLLLLRDSSPYIRNASLLIPNIDRTLSSNESIGTMSQVEYEALSVSTNHQESPFVLYDNRLFISIPYPDPALLPFDGKPIFIISVEIDRSGIQEVLKQIPGHMEGGAMLLDRQLRWDIAGMEKDGSLSVMNGLLRNEPISGETAGIHSVEADGRNYLVTSETSNKLGASLVTYLPENVVLGPLDKYKRAFWLLSAFSLLVILISSSLIYRFIHRPLITLVRAFKKAEIGNLSPIEQYRFRDEFFYLFKQYNATVEQLKVLIHEVYEQKYRAQLSELRQLQSQINPHFLYNSMFSVYRMAKSEDWVNVTRFTKYLGEYFRFITRSGIPEVGLETEVKFARTYVEIQNVRFAHRLKVEFAKLPELLKDVAVPRLVLQPLIENAYNYGLENKKADGLIRISFTVSDNFAVIAVEDNGEELAEDKLEEMQRTLTFNQEPAESTGLYNVHRRIRIKYGETGGLRLTRSGQGGLLAEIFLPLHKVPQNMEEKGAIS